MTARFPLVLLPTRLLLAGARKHGGPVEVLYQLTPVMSLTLMLLSLGHEQLWTRLPASPYFATVWMGLLSFTLIFAGAIIAFAMVVAEFALIANTSALTFMVAGTFKEIVTGGRSGYEAGCVMRGVVHGRRGRLCCERQGCSGGRDEGGWAEAFAASPWQQGMRPCAAWGMSVYRPLLDTQLMIDVLSFLSCLQLRRLCCF
jgi:hypothetical protein